MLANLLTHNIKFAQGDPQNIAGELYPEEDVLTDSTVYKRHREFVAGRVLAREVLARWGIHHFPLRVGENREPLWPQGVIGSITHAKGYCAVAAVRGEDILGLGIDVEHVDRLKEKILPTVCTPQELHFLSALPSADLQGYAMLIFSAKESFYKCQYPLTHQWVGFQDVTIQILVENKRFEVQLNKDIVPSLPKESIVEGRYCFENGYVATSVVLFKNRLANS